MSEFEKELEKNMKLRKVAYERESIDSDYFVSKWDIERIFKGWQPPKPLVVVPQIIGDWIELIKQRNRNVLALLDSDDMPCDVYDWLFIQEDDENIKLILLAWVKGYTVEKEQLYEIRIPLPNGNYASIDSKGYIWGELIPNKYKLTESEVKNIDERYWAFAVPV